MKMLGTIYEIVHDQRDPKRALVRIQLDGSITRPALSMSYADAGEFRIGEPITLTLTKLREDNEA